MNRLTFAVIGAAALALSACGSKNQDQVDDAVMNQPDVEQLNDLANDAANDAANTPAPAPVTTPADQNASAPVNTTVNPSDDEEQNVSGM
ncbi:hypothetical protein ACUXST_002375 [Sphingomonas sp. F9_3S_D5_B_2]|jgi:hypothetical protein